MHQLMITSPIMVWRQRGRAHTVVWSVLHVIRIRYLTVHCTCDTYYQHSIRSTETEPSQHHAGSGWIDLLAHACAALLATASLYIISFPKNAPLASLCHSGPGGKTSRAPLTIISGFWATYSWLFRSTVRDSLSVQRITSLYYTWPCKGPSAPHRWM